MGYFKVEKIKIVRKSDIKKSAQDYINNHIDCTLSGVEKSFIYEGYINGAIDILESLGTFINSDDEDIN